MPHPAVEERRLMTAPEAAEQLRVSTWRLYELCREGLLPHVRLGRSVRVDPGALDRFIASGGTTDSDSDAA